MRCTELMLIEKAATAVAVQCVVSPGGSVSVSATTRSVTASPSSGMREGRVLSTSNPSVPASMKLCCQRQTQVLDVPVTHDLIGANAIG